MSEHSSQWYRDQTNQLIQSLSKNDQQYFEDLQLYLVTKRPFHAMSWQFKNHFIQWHRIWWMLQKMASQRQVFLEKAQENGR